MLITSPWVDVRESSATPSAFILILNQSRSRTLASTGIKANDYALVSPPEPGATLLDTLFASPDRFPFLTRRSSAALCTITTDLTKCDSRPESHTVQAVWDRPKHRTSLSLDGDGDIERPPSLDRMPQYCIKPLEVVFVRRWAAAAKVQPAFSAEVKRQASAGAEVARLKKRRTDRPPSEPAVQLLGSILGPQLGSPLLSPPEAFKSSDSVVTQTSRGEMGRPAPKASTSIDHSSSTALPSFVPPPTQPFQPSRRHRDIATSTPLSIAQHTSLTSDTQKETSDGFPLRQPPVPTARIGGGGGRALNGTGSIFRGAKWS